MRARSRTPKRRKPADWLTPEQELAEGVPLERYTGALAGEGAALVRPRLRRQAVAR